jgi:uncharacterized protein (DUF58 family)
VTLRRGLAYDAGQRRARVPGAGTVFERLREYLPDDDPRSISWTATARRGRPITVEYETERQQRILILLDAGRMMSSTLGGLTKLDHAVNTALMLSYVATAKGDEVGLLDSPTPCARTPCRGAGASSSCASPRSCAASRSRRPSRTTARPSSSSARARHGARWSCCSPISSTMKRPARSSPRSRASPATTSCCAAFLADPQLAEVAAKVPSSTTELYERVVAEDVQEARARALAILRRRGVHTIDVPAERLTVATIQRYSS